MTLDELSLILEELGIPCDNLKVGGRNNNRVMISCPYAEWMHPSGSDSRPSMAIWLEEETSCKYKCWTCHEVGSLWELVFDVGTLSKNPEMQALALNIQRTDSPKLGKVLAACNRRTEGWGSRQNGLDKAPVLSDGLLKHFPEITETCSGGEYISRPDRQIPFEVARKYDLRTHESNQRLLFPVYTRKKEFQGFVGRDMTGTQHAKYYNYFNLETSNVLGGMQYAVGNVKRVLVVEGFFDLLGLARWVKDPQIVPLCTFKAEVGEIQARQLLALDAVIDFWYDADDAGDAGVMRATKLLTNLGGVCKKTTLPPNTDPHTLQETQVITLLNSTR